MESLAKQFENLVLQQSSIIAEKTVDLQYEKQPELWKPYGSEGRRLSVRDAGYHLPFLTEAIAAEDIELFREYVAWVKTLFKGLNYSDEIMITTLESTNTVLKEMLPADMHSIFEPYIYAGIDQMNKPGFSAKNFIDQSTETGKLAADYINALLKGDRHLAAKLILDSVEAGISVKTIYLEVFQKSQYEIGNLWLNNKISVATEHFCSAATQSIMSMLYPHIFATKRIGKTFVAACVGGELHEIGIRMVSDFFEIEGWDTYYLGANTPADTILQAIDDNQAQLVGLSAAMPYHRKLIRETISKIRNSDTGKNVKIIIGGNAINIRKGQYDSFGADGFAPDAENATKIGAELTK